MSLKMQQTGTDGDYRAVKYSQGGALAGDGGEKEKWKERKEPLYVRKPVTHMLISKRPEYLFTWRCC